MNMVLIMYKIPFQTQKPKKTLMSIAIAESSSRMHKTMFKNSPSAINQRQSQLTNDWSDRQLKLCDYSIRVNLLCLEMSQTRACGSDGLHWLAQGALFLFYNRRILSLSGVLLNALFVCRNLIIGSLQFGQNWDGLVVLCF